MRISGYLDNTPAFRPPSLPFPQGNTGIAAQYPRDSGITSNGAVIFADGFESYNVPNDLWNTFYNVFQMNRIRFATEPGNVY